MDLVSQARAAAESPVKIRRFWNSGTEHRPPEWPIEADAGPDGRARLDEPYTILAQAANEFGESFLVLEITETGTSALKRLGRDAEPAVRQALQKLGHARALALLRTGLITAGQELLQQLFELARQDPEIIGALARTWKDLAFLEDSASGRKRCLEKSHELYREAYEATKGIFPGINTAATALWLGKAELAVRLAREVAENCRKQLAIRPQDYWALATHAEGRLILRESAEATQSYAQARALVDQSHKWANLASTRKQARRLCEK